jgi:hypothetical protein
MRRKKLLLVPVGAIAGVLVVAASAFACTNYVGRMAVFGNNTGTGTVTVTGLQSYNEASQAMTQTVSSGIAKSDHTSSTWAQIWYGPEVAHGWKLATGTYDVNFYNGGNATNYSYTNHTTWHSPDPGGDCMTWIVGGVVSKLGTVHIDASGNIDSGAGTNYVSYDSTTKYVKFSLKGTSTTTSVSPKESGLCVSDSTSVNGNQAPITIV